MPFTVTTRRATRDDVLATARVFGEAFEDYRRGFGVGADALARLWEESLGARFEQTTVAVDEDGAVVGFIVTVPPGHKEQYGNSGTGRRRFALMRAELGLRNFWRLPALFIPMGFAYAKRHTRPDEHYISLVGVDPAVQGKGIGQALLAAAEEEARSHNAAGILLHTASTNVRARSAYSRAGYRLVSTVRAPWRGPADILAYVALRKPLTPEATPTLDALTHSPPLQPSI